jgi:hypothetical protein
MQEITVKEVRGPLGKGKQQFYAVVDEKGGEFTTFDTKIKQVTPGSRLGIEIKVEGKYINIVEWKVLEEGKAQALSLAQGNGAHAKTPEQFGAERRSIESQVAFKGMIELMAQGRQVPDDLREAVFDYARSRLQVAPVVKASTAKKAEPKVAADAPIKEELFPGSEAPQAASFKNAGEFLTACAKEKGLNRSDVEKKFDVKSMEELLEKCGTFEKAYLQLLETAAGEK